MNKKRDTLMSRHNARMVARKPATGDRVHWHQHSDVLKKDWYDTGTVGYVYTNGFCVLLSDDGVHGHVVSWDELEIIGA